MGTKLKFSKDEILKNMGEKSKHQPKPKGRKRAKINFIDINDNFKETLPTTKVLKKPKDKALQASSRASELCSIIESASRSNVSKIRLSNCYIEFFDSIGNNTLELKKITEEPADISAHLTPEPTQVEEALSPQVELSLKGVMDDFHIQNLMIEDPLGYEEHMIDACVRGNNQLNGTTEDS